MSEFKICPFCGKAIEADANTCQYCGKEIAVNDTQNNIEGEATAKAETFKPSDAFSYMFTDKSFISKAIILYIVVVVSVVLMSGFQAATQAKIQPTVMQVITFIIGFLISFVISGYSFSCVKALTAQEANYILPSVEPLSNFISGFKYVVALFLLCFPLGIISAIVASAIIFLPVIFKVLILIALLFLICKYVWVALSFYWIFAHKNYFTLFFKYKLGKEVIANSKGRFGKGVLYLVLFGILSTIVYLVAAGIGSILFNGNTLMPTVFATLINTYFFFVIAFVYAKMINPECVNMLK